MAEKREDYEVLGVDRNATHEEIKKAYRKHKRYILHYASNAAFYQIDSALS